MQMSSISASLNWESRIIVCIFSIASPERGSRSLVTLIEKSLLLIGIPIAKTGSIPAKHLRHDRSLNMHNNQSYAGRSRISRSLEDSRHLPRLDKPRANLSGLLSKSAEIRLHCTPVLVPCTLSLSFCLSLFLSLILACLSQGRSNICAIDGSFAAARWRKKREVLPALCTSTKRCEKSKKRRNSERKG